LEKKAKICIYNDGLKVKKEFNLIINMENELADLIRRFTFKMFLKIITF